MPSNDFYSYKSPSSSSILPSIGNPKWKRTFRTTDIEPTSSISLHDNSSSSSSSKTSGSPRRNATSYNACKTTCITIGTKQLNDNENDDKSKQIKQEDVSCPICNKYDTRYTCPKCFVPFCSVECYRIHDLPPDGNEKVGGGTCTERFYRKKVKQISHLDIQDEINVSQMKNIMTRSFYNEIGTENNTNGGGLNINQKDDKTSSSEAALLSEDELIELASHVLTMKDIEALRNVENGIENEVKAESQGKHNYSSYHHDSKYDSNNVDNNDTIPEHLRIKFEQAVQRGELSHLIAQWYPYWLPDYHNNETKSGITEIGSSTAWVDDKTDKKERHNEINQKQQCYTFTLDERILSIPKVAKLSSSQPVVQLQFNICELLYQTSFILRTYNGCDIGNKGAGKYIEAQKSGLSEQMKAVDIDAKSFNIQSAIHLHSRSFVLSKDERYENINKVLMDCTIIKDYQNIRENFHNRGSNNNNNMKDCNGNRGVDSKMLLNDLSNICQSKRMVLRVLFDTIDILDVGYKCLKKNRECQTTVLEVKKRSGITSGTDTVNVRKKLKLAKKKVEYYLSWMILHWDMVCCQLMNDIVTWMNDWVLKDDDGLHMDDVAMIRNATDMHTVEQQPKRKEIILPFISVEKDVNSRSVSVSSSGPLLVPLSTKEVVQNNISND